jgi:hypothetical protein
MAEAIISSWKTAIIAIVAGLVSGGATIAVNDFKVAALESQFGQHVHQSRDRHRETDLRIRKLEVETAADIREIKTILERMERGR